jgi:hypothetical protein
MFKVELNLKIELLILNTIKTKRFSFKLNCYLIVGTKGTIT